MDTQNEVNLGECIEAVTGRNIGMRVDEYVYIDTKEKVEDEKLALAIKMKSDKESVLRATQYQRDRAKEYAKLNQFAMQFDDSVNGTTTWIDAINEIKAKYQKPVKRNL